MVLEKALNDFLNRKAKSLELNNLKINDEDIPSIFQYLNFLKGYKVLTFVGLKANKISD